MAENVSWIFETSSSLNVSSQISGLDEDEVVENPESFDIGNVLRHDSEMQIRP